MQKLIFILLLISVSLNAAKKKACFILAEEEYQTQVSLPHFANQVLGQDFELAYVYSNEKDRNHLQGLEGGLEDADVLILSAWRLALKPQQLELIRQYVKSGKPIVALRTSTHGFALRKNQKAPEGTVFWNDFDQEILGCKYDGHFPSSEGTAVYVDKSNKKLAGSIKGYQSRSWLYKINPLAKDVKVLFHGVTSAKEPHPVAWLRTNAHKGRVFCTTLGHQEDFMQKSFQEMLFKGIYWAAAAKQPAKMPKYQFFDSYVENDFPWFTSTVDGRKAGKAFPGNNLTARGIILKPGNDFYACFDTDLLRYAVIWKGKGLEMNSMAPGSYNVLQKNRKSSQGEKTLPTPKGLILTALSPVAGLDSGKSKWSDPRPAPADPKQICNGPLPAENGRWNGILMPGELPILSYSLAKTEVFETLLSRTLGNGVSAAERRIKIIHASDNLYFHLGEYQNCKIATFKDFAFIKYDGKVTAMKLQSSSVCSFANQGARLDIETAAGNEIDISLLIWTGLEKDLENFRNLNWKMTKFPDINKAADLIWPGKETTRMIKDKSKSEILIDEVELPLVNKQRRNIRISGINFFKDGRAAVCTFDGDVWIIENLHKAGKDIKWKRFASGLNEPQNLVIKNGQIYVFDRNGIIRLHDRNSNGEADFYENFCSLPIQTAETREFAMDFKLLKDGSFVIAKGGQRGSTVNPHAGTIIHISADGKAISTIATGLREPYIGVDKETGDIFASDQQGHWVPSSPFYYIEKDGYYGFKPPFVKSSKNPLEPATWIPHNISQSGASLIKIGSKKMGPLNNQLLYLDYTIPSLNVVFFDRTRPKQAAFMRLSDKFSTPLLKAAVNPTDGLLYVSGFQIWGTKAGRIAGLLRIRPAKHLSIPKDICYFKEGILLTFNENINPQTLTPHLFKLERWNYLRSNKYGSGYYKLDGNKGRDDVGLSSVTLSNDKKSVFIAVPEMVEVMQMALHWKILGESGQTLKDSAYFSVNELIPFDGKNKFPEIDFSAKALTIANNEVEKPSAVLGKKVSLRMGCTACHSEGSDKEGKAGPPWKGIFGSMRTLTDGKSVKADEDYLRESILKPNAKVVKNYQPAMLPYEGVLKEHEVESLILYLKSLK